MTYQEELDFLGIQQVDPSLYIENSENTDNDKVIDQFDAYNKAKDEYLREGITYSDKEIYNLLKHRGDYKVSKPTFAHVKYNIRNTSGMNYRYTKHLFINADNMDIINDYCLRKFGKTTVELKIGEFTFDNYKIDFICIDTYIQNINKLIRDKIKFTQAEDLDNGKHIGQKRVLSKGKPFILNGTIQYEKDEVTYIYPPDIFEEIIL